MHQRTYRLNLIFFVLFLICGVTIALFADIDSSAGNNEPAIVKSDDATKTEGAFRHMIVAPFRVIGKIFRGKDKNLASKSKKEKIEDKHEASKFATTEIVSTSIPTPNPTISTASSSPVAPNANADKAERPRRAWRPFDENVAREDHLAQGSALLSNGNLSEAISELSIAATIGPNLLEANRLLGIAYARRGAHREAQVHYERALGIAPHDVETHAALAESLYQSGQFGAALKHLRQANHIAPADEGMQNYLALMFFRLGKYKDAYKSLARTEGDYAAHVKIAEMFAVAGHTAEAIKHYEIACRLPAAPVEARQRLNELYAHRATVFAQTEGSN